MWNKAERGEVINHAPIGYLRSLAARNGVGDFIIDPDEQVQAVVRLVFEQFSLRRSINGLLKWLVKNEVKLPVLSLSCHDCFNGCLIPYSPLTQVFHGRADPARSCRSRFPIPAAVVRR